MVRRNELRKPLCRQNSAARLSANSRSSDPKAIGIALLTIERLLDKKAKTYWSKIERYTFEGLEVPHATVSCAKIPSSYGDVTGNVL